MSVCGDLARIALTTGHIQCTKAERFVDVEHSSVWLYFVRPEAQTCTHMYNIEVILQIMCNCSDVV